MTDSPASVRRRVCNWPRILPARVYSAVRSRARTIVVRAASHTQRPMRRVHAFARMPRVRVRSPLAAREIFFYNFAPIAGGIDRNDLASDGNARALWRSLPRACVRACVNACVDLCVRFFVFNESRKLRIVT